MPDTATLPLILAALFVFSTLTALGWLSQNQRAAIAFLTPRPKRPAFVPRTHGERPSCAYLIVHGALHCAGCKRSLGLTYDEAIHRHLIACHRCGAVAVDRRDLA